MNGLAVPIAQYLDFDVTRLFEIFFKINRIVAEGGLGLGPRRLEGRGKFLRGAGDFHAAPAAAGRRLYENREAEHPRHGQRFRVGGDCPRRAWDARNSEPERRRFGRDLIAHEPDVFRLRADEGNVMVRENLGEPRILGKESIAWMQGFGAGDFAGGKKGWNVQIGIPGGGRPDAHRFIGELHMHRMGVGRRVNRHGRDAELLGGAQNPQGDFAAIGDKDFVEHVSPLATRPYSMTSSGWPYSTG